MGWWSRLSVQMLANLSKYPAVQMYAREGMHYIQNNPSVKKSVSAMFNSWAKTKRQMESFRSTSGFTGCKSGQNEGYVKWVVGKWNKHKGRVMSFFAVNFMGIIFFIQFGSSVLAMLWQVVAELFHEKAIDRKEVPSRAIKTHVQSSTDPGKQNFNKKFPDFMEEPRGAGDTSELLSVSEDSSNEATKHSLKQMEYELFGELEKSDFSTSFKFRMSEEDSFRSSLDDTVVTGSGL